MKEHKQSKETLEKYPVTSQPELSTESQRLIDSFNYDKIAGLLKQGKNLSEELESAAVELAEKLNLPNPNAIEENGWIKYPLTSRKGLSNEAQRIMDLYKYYEMSEDKKLGNKLDKEQTLFAKELSKKLGFPSLVDESSEKNKESEKISKWQSEEILSNYIEIFRKRRQEINSQKPINWGCCEPRYMFVTMKKKVEEMRAKYPLTSCEGISMYEQELVDKCRYSKLKKELEQGKIFNEREEAFIGELSEKLKFPNFTLK